MKLERINPTPVFNPVVITLETHEELREAYSVLGSCLGCSALYAALSEAVADAKNNGNKI